MYSSQQKRPNFCVAYITVLVTYIAELKAGDPSIAHQVRDFLGQLRLGEWGEVRQGLELLLALGRPHLHDHTNMFYFKS